MDPDVIGLQEVIHRPKGAREHCQACVIADAWRAAGGPARTFESFGPAFTYQNGDQFGNAIVSRYPLHQDQTFPHPTEDQRSLHFARVETPAGLVPFFVTHYSWRLDEGVVREDQALFTARTIDATVRDGDLPAILVGDLNAAPDTTELRFLRGVASIERTSTFFTDCFERCGEGPGFTFDPPKNPHAALTWEVPRRIDYVLTRGPDDHGRGLPLSARVVLDEVTEHDGSPIAPSDHYGVFAEIRME